METGHHLHSVGVLIRHITLRSTAQNHAILVNMVMTGGDLLDYVVAKASRVLETVLLVKFFGGGVSPQINKGVAPSATQYRNLDQ